jgi:hypothetical protein
LRYHQTHHKNIFLILYMETICVYLFI